MSRKERIIQEKLTARYVPPHKRKQKKKFTVKSFSKMLKELPILLNKKRPILIRIDYGPGSFYKTWLHSVTTNGDSIMLSVGYKDDAIETEKLNRHNFTLLTISGDEP